MRRIAALVLFAAAVLAWPLTAATPTAKPEEVGFSSERLHRINDLVQRHITAGNLSGTFLSQGSFGWSGAYGTHFWIDPKEKIVGILMTQTPNNEIRGDFENAVMYALVGGAVTGTGTN